MSLARQISCRRFFFALHFRLRRLFSRSTPVSCCPPRMSVLCVVLPFARRPFLDLVRRACHLAAAASWFRQDRTPFLSLPAAIAPAVSWPRPPHFPPVLLPCLSAAGRKTVSINTYSPKFPAGRHGLAGNLLFLHRFERLRRAGQHRFRAEGTRDRIQLKTFR